ncbi:YkvA family protein [Leptolyngbya sp. NM3-A1]
MLSEGTAMTSPLQGLYNWYRQTLRNPKYRWWVILGTLAYLVMPFDVVPDFLPLFGQLDDALLVSLLVAEVSQVLIDRVSNKKVNRTDDKADTTVAEEVEVKAVPLD